MKNQTQTVVLLGLLLTLAVVHESGAFTAGIGNMGMSGKRDLTTKVKYYKLAIKKMILRYAFI